MQFQVSLCHRTGVFEAKIAVFQGLKIHVSPVRSRPCPSDHNPPKGGFFRQISHRFAACTGGTVAHSFSAMARTGLVPFPFRPFTGISPESTTPTAREPYFCYDPASSHVALPRKDIS
jgi:hypothetical protein